MSNHELDELDGGLLTFESNEPKYSFLQMDENGLKEYVQTIISAGESGGNSFYTKEENIYKMLGVGNVEAGKLYYLNQAAVRDYIMENYK